MVSRARSLRPRAGSSTISQLRHRKLSFRKVFRWLFDEVVRQCIAKGLVSGRVVGTDLTHVRANASCASEELVEISEAPGAYWEQPDAYEEEGLEALAGQTGKRRKKRTKQIRLDNRRTKKRVSRTDPESGHLNRPGTPRGPAYLAHQAVDSDYGIIVGQAVTSGDVNVSVPYLELSLFKSPRQTPPTISRWRTGCWAIWGSTSSCVRRKPLYGQLHSLHGMIFTMIRGAMYTSAPEKRSCV